MKCQICLKFGYNKRTFPDTIGYRVRIFSQSKNVWSRMPSSTRTNHVSGGNAAAAAARSISATQAPPPVNIALAADAEPQPTYGSRPPSAQRVARYFLNNDCQSARDPFISSRRSNIIGRPNLQ
ncbi:conserved hypothetical protein [Ricinus communis]|uniref:Uncharacterized protein n=1 Tax=Ricinus communis TaxID=3988 RepID=B9T5Z9_RICCO|nr:conserved hypothetical protein [Ricinus communis]